MAIEIDRPVSQDFIPTELKPAVAQVTNLYVQTFGSRLQSVYLLGGAARGEYRPGKSDFDIRAIVSQKIAGEREEVERQALPVQQRFNIAKMEMDVYEVEMLNKRDWLQFYVLVDGVCVWGTPYEPTYPLPTTKEALATMLASHLLDHYERMPATLERVRSGNEEGNPILWQEYAKRALRLGNVLSILRSGQYTQNGDRMVENIKRNVPEISEAIAILDHYRVTPATNLDDFNAVAKASGIVHAAVIKSGLGSGLLAPIKSSEDVGETI